MKIRQLTLASFFIALGIVLPFFTMQIPSIGSMLLPMHLPVLLSGFVLGPHYGALIGFLTPLIRSAIFGMPPFISAFCMAFELAAYGFFTGYFYKHSKKTNVDIYKCLFISMIIGRIIWGIVSMIIFSITGEAFTFAIFFASAFTTAIPGIILQIAIIPTLVLILKKGKYLYE